MPGNYRLSAACPSGVRRQWNGWAVRPLEPQITIPPWFLLQSASSQIPIFSTPELAYPNNVTSGNLLICALASNSGTSFSGVTAFGQGTWAKAVGYSVSNSIDVELWYTKAIFTGATTVIATLSGNANTAIAIAEYSNTSGIAASPLDQTVSAQGNGGAVQLPSLGVTVGDELAVFAITQGAANISNLIPHGGYAVEQVQGNGNTAVSIYLLDQYPVYGSTVPAATFFRPPTQWAAVAATFKHG